MKFKDVPIRKLFEIESETGYGRRKIKLTEDHYFHWDNLKWLDPDTEVELIECCEKCKRQGYCNTCLCQFHDDKIHSCSEWEEIKCLEKTTK